MRLGPLIRKEYKMGVFKQVKETACNIGNSARLYYHEHEEAIWTLIGSVIGTAIVTSVGVTAAYDKGLGEGFVIGQNNACEIISHANGNVPHIVETNIKA
jgi:hypothetical protein